jgi:hypothetical protein
VPQVRETEYRALPLRVHALLADTPLHDVWAVDLPGRREGLTLAELQRVSSQHPLTGRLALPARALFGLRRVLGFVFRLEVPAKRVGVASLASGLTAEDRAKSSPAPGTPAGQFLVVYAFESERLLEIHNRTVHAALLTALAATETGHRFYLAVYVRSVGFITPVYMALIDPFRRWIIYPAILNHIRAVWAESS